MVKIQNLYILHLFASIALLKHKRRKNHSSSEKRELCLATPCLCWAPTPQTRGKHIAGPPRNSLQQPREAIRLPEAEVIFSWLLAHDGFSLHYTIQTLSEVQPGWHLSRQGALQSKYTCGRNDFPLFILTLASYLRDSLHAP